MSLCGMLGFFIIFEFHIGVRKPSKRFLIFRGVSGVSTLETFFVIFDKFTT